MTQREPLSLEAFQAMLAELLDVDATQLSPDTHFVTDLGADSLDMLEMLLRLEELGIDLSLDAAREIQTVGDAYRCCQQQSR